MLRWIGRFSVLRKRLYESWMDLLQPIPANHPQVLQGIQLAQQAAGDDVMIDPNDIHQQALNRQRADHEARYPFNDHLLSLIFTCLADLAESQRERMQSTMSLRNFTVENYTYEAVREVLI